MALKPSVEKIARTIEGAHSMLALGLKAPALRISAAEAKMLAEGVLDVGEQYDLPINPKVLAWLNLVGAACAVYGPRAFIMFMTSQQKGRRPNPTVAGAASAEEAARAAAQSGASATPPADTPPPSGTIKYG